jgi:hypothetical protein
VKLSKKIVNMDFGLDPNDNQGIYIYILNYSPNLSCIIILNRSGSLFMFFFTFIIFTHCVNDTNSWSKFMFLFARTSYESKAIFSVNFQTPLLITRTFLFFSSFISFSSSAKFYLASCESSLEENK